MRLAAAFALAIACGCSTPNPSYIDARGKLGDGTPFDVRFGAVVVDTGNPWKLQTAASASAPPALAGFWLWFDPTVVMQGQSYSSTGSSQTAGALHFFAVFPEAGTDAVVADLVDGGSFAFTAGGPDNWAGTIGPVALVRMGQTLLTVDGGAFFAGRPQ